MANINNKIQIGSEVVASLDSKEVMYDTNTSVHDKIDEVNASLNGLEFAQDSSGNWGYRIAGADTVIPFKNGYEDTPGTATSADIAKGKTAWVNGVKVTGTAVLVDSSSGYIILSSSNTSTGKEITGGWTPSGAFRAEKQATITAQTNNLINLTHISHVDFSYNFTTRANDGDNGSSYCSFYLINNSGTTSNTITKKVSSTGCGTFSASINTSSISGNYRIGYKLYSNGYDTDKGSWTEHVGSYASIYTISMF